VIPVRPGPRRCRLAGVDTELKILTSPRAPRAPDGELLTIKKTAEILGVAASTLPRRLTAGSSSVNS
jgi:hypothetical protein